MQKPVTFHEKIFDKFAAKISWAKVVQVPGCDFDCVFGSGDRGLLGRSFLAGIMDFPKGLVKLLDYRIVRGMEEFQVHLLLPSVLLW